MDVLPVTEPLRLTKFSHGGGCGCKISPSVLEEILKNHKTGEAYKHLIVGNSSNDDAAVYDIGGGRALISTTDFFMPIVDDPFDFGRIASANAISDVYAMGGTPLLAIAILGWPVNKIPPVHAAKVIEGGRSICADAGIPLAGGHSIDSPEPVFGLAVTGMADIRHIKRNDTAREGDLLFLTKPLGTGILGTAVKKGIISGEDYQALISGMCSLNKVGEQLGKIEGVHALTDVTGFGLLGHLLEMCRGSRLSAEVSKKAVPLYPDLQKYIAAKCFPDNTYRNWSSYGASVKGVEDDTFITLSDPQTSGGLLAAVAPSAVDEYRKTLLTAGLPSYAALPIGKMKASTGDFHIDILG